MDELDQTGIKSPLSSGSVVAISTVGGGARDGVAGAVLGVTSPLLGGCHCPEALGAVRRPIAGSELALFPFPSL